MPNRTITFYLNKVDVIKYDKIRKRVSSEARDYIREEVKKCK